ncbi:metal-dependent hydrolase [Ramlibacter tataouinensis]|uniref:Candidate Membrane-bound metal-dependent hydrolase n=1 Tax=Ramlibacter tataouinensis (strain ATCC BAA-407 / DSM 14655 / LMG 21543 / TTB310) TaxID=365046 RepID=F5Y3Y6_RAMTT|nr:metal-dependent hydrolase [Ramlibacter tataouinensis]AEG91264.1 Candidate Membrane-bound metal-dependent hydrolase [Ramlibacter tataouinensis TTB310]
MDSLSQLALGAAVGVAVMGRRTAVWKAALWGGIAGTLPDLDALIDHGDAVRNMTLHRAASHSLFWLTLGAPLLAALASRLHGERQHFRRWWLAMWLALVTHPLLDTMTVYGTQLLQPFSDHPFGVGSIFIIDPLYTLPLLAGVVAALAWRGDAAGLNWNRWGLFLSTAYLAWTALAQWHVRGIAEQTLAARGTPARQLLVTPTAFNTVLWRVVAMREDGFEEGYYSLLDPERTIRFQRHDRQPALKAALDDLWAVQRIAWFSHGFYKMQEQGGSALIVDLRMGQEPSYIFTFEVARRGDDGRWVPVTPENIGSRGDLPRGLAWLWQRLRGQDVPPPR